MFKGLEWEELIQWFVSKTEAVIYRSNDNVEKLFQFKMVAQI